MMASTNALKDSVCVLTCDSQRLETHTATKQTDTDALNGLMARLRYSRNLHGESSNSCSRKITVCMLMP